MSAARFAPLLLSALCLSACAAGPRGEAVGRYPAPASGVAGGGLLASLPPAAGRVVGVRRLSYANGLGQEIVLDGPRPMTGENLITVRALTTSRTGGRGAAGEEMKLGPASDTEIAAEMERQLPGLAMRIAAAPERDADGAIGYAVGTAGRLACVYAWQYIAPARPVSLFEGVSDTGALPMSVRVRLCREQPVAALLDDLRGLRVSRPEDGNGVAGTRPARDALDTALGSAIPQPAATAPEPRPDVEAPRPHRRPQHRGPLARPHPFGPAGRPRRVARRTEFPRALERDARPVALVPPLPMPSDVAAAAPVAPRRPAPTGAPTSGDDGLPMPR